MGSILTRENQLFSIPCCGNDTKCNVKLRSGLNAYYLENGGENEERSFFTHVSLRCMRNTEQIKLKLKVLNNTLPTRTVAHEISQLIAKQTINPNVDLPYIESNYDY